DDINICILQRHRPKNSRIAPATTLDVVLMVKHRTLSFDFRSSLGYSCCLFFVIINSRGSVTSDNKVFYSARSASSWRVEGVELTLRVG
ncbi:28481_t:CDS:2, partial [Dentiscutata erythropus]